MTLLFGQGLVPEQPFVLQIAQGWTLGTEVVFYALVPVVAVRWGRKRNGTPASRGARVLLVALAMLALSIAWHTLAPTDDTEWFYVFPSVAGAFAPGVALAAVETAWPERLASLRVRQGSRHPPCCSGSPCSSCSRRRRCRRSARCAWCSGGRGPA